MTIAFLISPSTFVTALEELSPAQNEILARIDSLNTRYESQAAADLVGEHLPVARAAADSSFLLPLLIRQGVLQAAFIMSPDAEPVLREALAIAEIRGDSLALLSALRWLGMTVDNAGRRDEAHAIYERLLAGAKVAGSRSHIGWAQVGFAWPNIMAGRSSEAAVDYRKAIENFQAIGEIRGETWATNGLGIALSNLGEFDESMSSYQRAAVLARADGNAVVESMALNNLGALAHSLGDPSEAVIHFQRAYDLQMSLGYTWSAITPALNIAFCRRQLGRYQDAKTDLERLLALCRDKGYSDFEGPILTNQGSLLLERKLYGAAEAKYRECLAMGTKLPMKNRLEARVGLARALSKQGRTLESLTVLEDGVKELRGRDLIESELRLKGEISLRYEKLGRLDEARAILVELTETSERLGLRDLRLASLIALAQVERGLGRDEQSLAQLREAAEIWEAERGLPLDPEWREKRGESGRLLFSDLADLLLSLDRGLSESERQREAFDQLQAYKSRTLLERMLGPGSAAAASLGALEVLSIDQLQWQVLREGELLLDYYLGTRKSWLFAVTRSGCRVLSIPSEAELAEKLTTYFAFLSNPPRDVGGGSDLAIVDSAAKELRRLLLADVEDLLAANDRIFFSPDGLLNLLVPATLFGRDEQGELEWSRIPSATVLAHIREAAPVEYRDGAAKVLALAGCRLPDGRVLPGAKKEAGMLACNFRDVDLSVFGEDPERDHVGFGVEDLADYHLLHLAAHADVDDQYPWHSAIDLLGNGEDGRLKAVDIAAARLDARLAVLAACESAAGRIVSGEGVLGLASAFISAGVPAVVATLWPVDDASTARLMRQFYSELAGGASVAGALHGAREEIRRDPATAHPFYWAAFVLIGDGQIQVPLEERVNMVRVGLLSLLGLLVLLVALGIWRRNSH